MDYREVPCIRPGLLGNTYISPFLLPGFPLYKPWITRNTHVLDIAYWEIQYISPEFLNISHGLPRIFVYKT